MTDASQEERTNCPIIAHPVVLAVLSTHTHANWHTLYWGERGWVRGWSEVLRRERGNTLWPPCSWPSYWRCRDNKEGWAGQLLWFGSNSVVDSHLSLRREIQFFIKCSKHSIQEENVSIKCKFKRSRGSNELKCGNKNLVLIVLFVCYFLADAQ